MSEPVAATNSANKSGLKQLKPGEILFNDGDVALSLFIIQKGQLRLYKPKGKGFIEIAVLRTGEVIGEMAFFDEDGSGNKRSCSASAMVPTEIIEISFTAFGKTMSTLNPWFKTIINTLASRLRKSNARIKELESNAGTVAYGNKAGEYEFIKPFEILRILGVLFLVYKTHGENHQGGVSVHRKTIELYSGEIFQISEAKFDAVVFAFRDLGWLEIFEDEDKNPMVYVVRSVDLIRSIFIFYNTEKHLPEGKRMKLSVNCEGLLEKMLEHLDRNPTVNIPNLKAKEAGDRSFRFEKYYPLTSIITEIKMRNLPYKLEHFEDARSIQVVGEQVSLNGEPMIEVDILKLQKLMPTIKFISMMNKVNREKSNF